MDLWDRLADRLKYRRIRVGKSVKDGRTVVKYTKERRLSDAQLAFASRALLALLGLVAAVFILGIALERPSCTGNTDSLGITPEGPGGG